MTTPETTPELSAQVTDETTGPAAWRALAEDVVRYGGFPEFDARMLLVWAAWARGRGDDALAAALRERPRNTAGDIFEAGATALRHVVRMAAALRAAADAVETQDAAIGRLADELETRDAEAERRAYFGPARAPLYGVTPDLHQPDPAAGRAAHSPTEGM
jgi:hypothetical protein